MTAAERILDLLSQPRVMREVFQALTMHNRERYLRNGMPVPEHLGDLTDLIGSLVAPRPVVKEPALDVWNGAGGIPLPEAAEVLGVRRQRVHQLIGDGRLRALQLPNRRWMVNREDVMDRKQERAA